MPRRNATHSRATGTDTPLASSSSSSTVRRSSRNPQPRSSRLHVDDTSDAVQAPAQAAREVPGRTMAPGRTVASRHTAAPPHVIVISDDDDSPAHPPAPAERSSSESDIEMLEPTAKAFASRIRSTTTASSSSARPPVQELMDTDSEDDENLVRASSIMTPAPPAPETQLSPRARTNVRAPRAPKQDPDHLTSVEKKLIDQNKDMSYPNLFILINRNRASERKPRAPLNTVLPIDWHRGSKHWWMGVKRDRPFWKPSDDPYLVRSGFAEKDDDDNEEAGAGAA